jgi:hypothetical protein
MTINFKFISELEGTKLTGYVPHLDGGNIESGVSVASGFDIGQRTVEELDDAFECELADKLSTYAGVTGEMAVTLLERFPLTIAQEECAIINEFAHKQATKRLLDDWPKSAVPFNCLADECQTVVASVSFQYGDLPTRTPLFWCQVTTSDWTGALVNLRNFKDPYPTRRNKEADYLERRMRE